MTTSIKSPIDPQNLRLDKQKLRQNMEALNRRMGFVRDPNATAEQARAMMTAQGIQPDDRLLSGEILRARYEAEE